MLDPWSESIFFSFGDLVSASPKLSTSESRFFPEGEVKVELEK